MDSKCANLLRTYKIRYEPIQIFELPPNCICTSLSVNPVMGEIMFACRSQGLLHYALNKESGVVYAHKPSRISYGDWGNVRLVKCEPDSGNYLVVNDQTLALVMVGYHMPTIPSSITTASKLSATDSESGTFNIVARRAVDSRHESCECVDFESERCAVGDVRDVAIDTENERIYLLYRDKLCRRIFPDMRHYSTIAQSRSNRCIGSELVCLAMGKKLLFVLTKSGDIKVRLKLEQMTDRMDQLAWRTIGYRLNDLVPTALNVETDISELEHRNKNDPRKDLGTTNKPQSMDWIASGVQFAGRLHSRESIREHSDESTGDHEGNNPEENLGPWRVESGESQKHTKVQSNSNSGGGSNKELVELASICVDSRRNILFAASGRNKLYAIWQLNIHQDTGSTGWTNNWIEDAWLDLSGTRDPNESPCNIDKLDMEKPAFSQRLAFEPLTPGPVACTASSTRKPGYLYVVDRKNCRRVMVIRYSTEPATVQRFSGEFSASKLSGQP